MRNAQPAQGLSATSFDFSSGRNGGRYGALRERLLPCRQRSQARMPTLHRGQSVFCLDLLSRGSSEVSLQAPALPSRINTSVRRRGVNQSQRYG
jgi:hypothetical protein